jgi:hypothetical protein
MWLVAATWTQLVKDRGTYLLETKLQDLCLDHLKDRRVIDLDVLEVELGGLECDWPIVEAGLEDICANLRRGERCKVSSAVL